MTYRWLALAGALAAAPLLAAERTVSVTDFDRLRVDGGFIVEVRTGPATTAKIIGTQGALEASTVSVQGRQLVVRRNRQAWGGYPGQIPPAATVRITSPLLSHVLVSGPARVSVERLKGLRVSASLEGSGTLSVTNAVADRLDLGAIGSGTMTIGGTVAQLTVIARGSGVVDTRALAAQDVKLTSESAGVVTLAAKRAADVTMTGSGQVEIIGKPACTVKNIGVGTVACGLDRVAPSPLP